MSKIQFLQKTGFIAIEGCIGVGKTTLAKILSNKLNGQLLLEIVEENPFLVDFYQNKDNFAFQTQIFFLLSRFKQQRELSQVNMFSRHVVSDYILDKDKIFAKLNLKESEYDLYTEIYNNLGNEIKPPDLLIYLRAPFEIIMQRIEKRGRTFEKNMDEEYIKNLILFYDEYFYKTYSNSILIVETKELNFPESEKDIELVVDAIDNMHKLDKNRVTLQRTNSQQHLF